MIGLYLIAAGCAWIACMIATNVYYSVRNKHWRDAIDMLAIFALCVGAAVVCHELARRFA